MNLTLVTTLALAGLAAASGPTSIFINQVPEYALLSPCAESQVSTIVRNMAFGCGDGSKTTSYKCFCYESSAKFSSMIGKHVQTACTQDASQNTSAVEVFSSYCQLGDISAVTSSSSSATAASSLTTSFLASSSVTPAPSQTANLAAATASHAVPSNKESSHVVPIVVGVSVPVGVVALGILGFVFYHRRGKAPSKAAELSGEDTASEAGPGREVHELGLETKPVEIDSAHDPAELGTPKKEVYRHELDSGTWTEKH